MFLQNDRWGLHWGNLVKLIRKSQLANVQSAIYTQVTLRLHLNETESIKSS